MLVCLAGQLTIQLLLAHGFCPSMVWIAIVCVSLVLQESMVLRALKNWVWLGLVVDWSFNDGRSIRLSSTDQALLILVFRTLVRRHFQQLVFRSHTCVQGGLYYGWGSHRVCQVGVHDLFLLVRWLHRQAHHLKSGVLHSELLLTNYHVMTDPLVQSIRNAFGRRPMPLKMRDDLWLWILSFIGWDSCILAVCSKATTDLKLLSLIGSRFDCETWVEQTRCAWAC